MIWDGRPFDSQITFEDALSGQIVEVFLDGSFLVQCFVDTLLILNDESDNDWSPNVGSILDSRVNRR